MSKAALTKFLDEVLASIPVTELGKVANANERNNTESFRKNLNKTVHILIINDYFIKSLAPRAEEILKSMPSAMGKDGNASAIRAILSEYRSMRGNKRGRVRKKQFSSTGEAGYVLTFPSFDAVRSFLSRLGLKGRSSEIYGFVHSNQDIKSRLTKLLGVESFSNENDLISALSRLSPLKNKAPNSEFYNNKEAEELYRVIYDEDLGFDVGHNIPVAYKQVDLFASNKQALKTVVDRFLISLGSSTKLTSSSINTIVKEVQAVALQMAKKTAIENNFVVEKTELDNSGKGHVTVFIESSKANQETESESRIVNEFKDLLLTRIKAQLRGKDAALKLLNQKGSKSYKEQILDIVTQPLTKKAISKQGTSKATKKHKTTLDTNVVSSKSSDTSTKQVTIPALRNLSGQFTSLLKLESLMRAMLLETIQKNMQRPNLRNQTGRFAESVKLDRLQRERDGAITAFLSYMKYPYATFEKGGRQGFRGYYPSRLLDQSAREIATKLVTARLKTVIV